jgi:hypothetical protein
VWKHRRSQIELYGSKGRLIEADPRQFAGGVVVSAQDAIWTVFEGPAHRKSDRFPRARQKRRAPRWNPLDQGKDR